MSVEPPRDASDNIASNNEVTSLEDIELPDATHDSTTDEMADPEAPSSLFADEETCVEPAVSNGGLQPDNDLAFASAVNSSPKPRGSVTFSIEDDREAEPSDDAHYRENIGFSKQSTCSTDTVGFTEVHERAPNINLRTFRQAERRKPRRKNGGSLLHRLRESGSRRKFLNWAKETGQVSHSNENQADTQAPQPMKL